MNFKPAVFTESHYFFIKERHFSIKKRNLAICKNIDRSRGYEINQRKTNSHVISHLHVECKNKKIKQKENRLTENKHVVAKEEGAEMRVDSGAWGRAAVHEGK